MHAVIGKWTMDPQHRAEQDHELHEIIVPMVRALPGFVAAYWTHDPVTSHSHTTIVFNDEQAACHFKEVVGRRDSRAAKAGVANDFLVVTEVLRPRYWPGSRKRDASDWLLARSWCRR